MLQAVSTIVLCLMLFRIPACSTWVGNGEFVDGVDLTATPEYRNYREHLRLYLTSADSMRYGKAPVLPPNCQDPSFVYNTSHPETGPQLNVVTDAGTVAFTNLQRSDGGNTYEFKAYDSKMRIAFLSEQNKAADFRLFGISLSTGNQFDVYRTGSLGMYREMYHWSFSPEFDYLLKTGDIGQDMYGWGLVDLKTGVEGFNTYVRFEEFLFGAGWIDKESFQFHYLRIPFKKGFEYRKDYGFFYSLMNRDPMPGTRLEYDCLYPVRYVADVKGRILSERLYNYDYLP